MKTTDNTTDYKQAWKSAEQGRWLANEEIAELKAQRDTALAALRRVTFAYGIALIRSGDNSNSDRDLNAARAVIAAAEQGINHQ